MSESIDTAALRSLAEAATPGPWHGGIVRAYQDEDGRRRGPGAVRTEGNAIVFMSANGPEILEDDADFIAAANPATILALLDRLEQAEALTRRHGELRAENHARFEQMRDERTAAQRQNRANLARAERAEAATERVRAIATQHRSVEQHNEMVSLSDIADLIREPSSADYLAALDTGKEKSE